MPIRIDALRSAAYRIRRSAARTLTEAKSLGMATAFLCHSHEDESLVKGLINLLEEAGWQVYVDWLDSSMSDKPTKETAAKIKQRIMDHRYFLFLATSNSTSSRWCPWEIGYADGVKDNNRILIIPTTDGYSSYGNEYLGLYRHIDLSSQNQLAVCEPGKTTDGTLVENLY